MKALETQKRQHRPTKEPPHEGAARLRPKPWRESAEQARHPPDRPLHAADTNPGAAGVAAAACQVGSRGLGASQPFPGGGCPPCLLSGGLWAATPHPAGMGTTPCSPGVGLEGRLPEQSIYIRPRIA